MREQLNRAIELKHYMENSYHIYTDPMNGCPGDFAEDRGRHEQQLSAQLMSLPGGQHFLSAAHATAEFVDMITLMEHAMNGEPEFDMPHEEYVYLYGSDEQAEEVMAEMYNEMPC